MVVLMGCFVVLFASGCSNKGVPHSSVAGALMPINPGKFYEACDNWKPGQTIEYSFQTDAPVDFDVHYHTKAGKEYPVKKDNVTEMKGTFVIEQEAIYCCFWKNNNAKRVALTHQFTVIK